ncbi:complex I intermediate-associated protein 30, mitochondrial-like [Clavelina lepadiformis]|uniref:complex I intermediate-associated protein 30, mitochondrial-like n=1 Tax=Clavelina lepadiformis TaxID=159417 RepID=UPI004041F79A
MATTAVGPCHSRLTVMTPVIRRWLAYGGKDSRPLLKAVATPINCPRRFLPKVGGTRHQETENQMVVQQEEVIYRPRQVRMDWLGMKRSWKYVLKTVRSMFSSVTENESTARLFKKDHVMYYFRNSEDLSYWYVMTDEDYGGHSWAELRQGLNEMTAMFRGYLSEKRPRDLLPTTDPLQPQPPYHGMVYLETRPFLTILDKREYMSLTGFNAVKLRLRGDGRKYDFEMVCDCGFEKRIAYVVPIYTRGGPLWQEIEIPYVKFMAKMEDGGYLLVRQRGMGYAMLENFRFKLQDGIEGPFQLEIDYIALIQNSTFPDEGTDNKDPWEPINATIG